MSTSRSICPGLKRTETGYVCEYSGRPVNPFAWYCVLDYYMCPIYVSHTKAEVEKPTEVKSEEVKPVEREVAEVTPPKVIELDEFLINELRNIVEKYENKTKEIEDLWGKYEKFVNEVKLNFDRENIIIEHYLTMLNRLINRYEEDLKEIEYRRYVGLIDDETYTKLKDSINEKLIKLKDIHNELNSRYLRVVETLLNHVKRIYLTTTSTEVTKLRLAYTKLGDLIRDGKISQNIYEKLKNEIEKLIMG